MEERANAGQSSSDPLRVIGAMDARGLVTLAPDGTVRSWSAGARSLFGYDAREAVGAHVSMLYPATDPPAWSRHLEAASSGGEAELDGWWQHKDGAAFWGSGLCSAAHGDGGALVGYVQVIRRLGGGHEHHALHDSEERFHLLVDSVKDYAIFMLDESGRVVTWNAGARAIKGYEAGEIIGQRIDVFYGPEDRAQYLPATLLARARAEGRVEHEGWRVRKDGTRFWADVVLTALRDPSGRLVGFAKVTRDLTERRKLEAERLRSAQALEAVRVREEFLSTAAHELRTPLAAMLLQLEAARERLGGREPEVARRLQRSIASGHRLAELIQALLDVSRITAGRLELHPERFDLREVASEVLDRMRDAAAKAGCTLGTSSRGDLTGCWDRMRIEQVLTNLVWNAIKYARGCPIEVCLEGHDDDVVLEVADRGPGIAPPDLPHLFQRFTRGESARHDGGLGLGLYLALQISEAHRGTVTARNRTGGGASFVVRLPRRAEALEPSPPQPPPAATGSVS